MSTAKLSSQACTYPRNPYRIVNYPWPAFADDLTHACARPLRVPQDGSTGFTWKEGFGDISTYT
eukprot:COSAG04_NODE_29629_length_267_cov_1.839286_1_plen_63_part_01